MHTTSDRNAVWRDHIEFHAMFIHLSQVCRCWNGERKGAGRLPVALRSGQRFANLAYLRFLLEGSYLGPNLVVGRQRDGGACVLLEA
jgi:hypothetical protein